MSDQPGPVSRGVYFRRRAGALAGSMLALVGLIWLVDGLIGGEEPVRGVAASVPLPASTAPASRRNAPASATAAQSATQSASRSARPSPSRTPEQVPPDPSAPCPDSSVRVSAETGEPAYRTGQRPLLRLVVVNTGPVPCTRDVGRALRGLEVTSRDGGTRVWSSNDCYFGTREGSPRVLAPKRRAVFEVRWTGRTSAAGCPVRRAPVAPGDYAVVPRLGKLTGAPVPLRLTA
ncbi:hypothetical protein ACTG9Q_11280 [Actinokineospora sp. 24-640]